jgi:pimeloyl-ACP methyl ester carboxylesterase
VSQASSFVDITWRERRVSIEHQWIAREQTAAPLLVFLHEGLGSVAMWKDFPAALCAAAGCRGLVYSRPGYGRSTPRSPDEHWGTDFMHRQAFEVLPALLQALDIDAAVDKPWLFGHSDGGSIALLYAARFPERIAGAIVAAPHIFVENISVQNIEAARQAYLGQSLRQGLAKYHGDVDSAFWGWNRIWLDPAFRYWNIAPEISAILCPLLALQGVDDEYGTMKQLYGIARAVPQTRVLELADCGHSPHRDQPEQLIAAVTEFLHHNLKTGDKK